jgi:hypothetical protein
VDPAKLESGLLENIGDLAAHFLLSSKRRLRSSISGRRLARVSQKRAWRPDS